MSHFLSSIVVLTTFGSWSPYNRSDSKMIIDMKTSKMIHPRCTLTNNCASSLRCPKFSDDFLLSFASSSGDTRALYSLIYYMMIWLALFCIFKISINLSRCSWFSRSTPVLSCFEMFSFELLEFYWVYFNIPWLAMISYV